MNEGRRDVLTGFDMGECSVQGFAGYPQTGEKSMGEVIKGLYKGLSHRVKE